MNQRVNRRGRHSTTRSVRRRFIEQAPLVVASLRETSRRILRNRLFPFAAPGFALLSASLVIALYFLGPKSLSPQDQSPVGSGNHTSGVESTSPLPGGTGIPAGSRDQDIKHTVAEGETFSEISYIYGISPEKLAAYNHIPDINRIKGGTIIKIPSLAAERKITVTTVSEPRRLAAAGNPAKSSVSNVPLKIEAEQQFDGPAVTAHFSLVVPPKVNLTRYEWDLGNGRKSFRPTTFWTYDVPGTYTVTLKAWDADGRQYSADEVFIDVPHPTTYQNTLQQFLTLENLDQTFTVFGNVTDVIHIDNHADSPMVEVSANEDSTKYKATRPGYFSFTAEKDGSSRQFYVFASPVDSKHSDRTDINWYRTQFNTGTQSNCGPAVASMAIAWATGEYVAVSTVRQEIGWTGDGSTSFEDIIAQLKQHHVYARTVPLDSPQTLFDIVDRGNIAIILYNSGGPRFMKGHPGDDMFGRYYYDAVGHYVIVKGYSKDAQYLVTYDPIPSDWGSNSFRYPDGISMIGRNRYYGTKELWGALRRWEVIEILREAAPASTASSGDLIHRE